MKIRTSELTGAALDLMVATALKMSWWTRRTADWDTNNGYTDWVLDSDGKLKKFYFDDSRSRAGHWEATDVFEPSTDWSQGGPIIEREELSVGPFYIDGKLSGWEAFCHKTIEWDGNGDYVDDSEKKRSGPTPLIAAMRCFVASKLGDEVDVPEGLL